MYIWVNKKVFQTQPLAHARLAVLQGSSGSNSMTNSPKIHNISKLANVIMPVAHENRHVTLSSWLWVMLARFLQIVELSGFENHFQQWRHPNSNSRILQYNNHCRAVLLAVYSVLIMPLFSASAAKTNMANTTNMCIIFSVIYTLSGMNQGSGAAKVLNL